MSNKRKWKVYTTDELKERFQPKPGASVAATDDQKVVVPNMKRRNSAPPGMIHFPPGTFSAGNLSQSPQPPPYVPSSPRQQHELVTHARHSPTLKSSATYGTPSTYNTPSYGTSPSSSPYGTSPASSPYGGGRLERRRASLPYIPSGSAHTAPPSIEAYLSHLQQMPLPPTATSTATSTSTSTTTTHTTHEEEDNPAPPLSPSHSLPSFQSLLQTIREDADEEDDELSDIAERAGGSPHLQSSKTMPTYMGSNNTKSPKQTHTFPFHTSNSPQEPASPSSKFYKNTNLSKSNDNLPSLSRMSISDIIS